MDSVASSDEGDWAKRKASEEKCVRLLASDSLTATLSSSLSSRMMAVCQRHYWAFTWMMVLQHAMTRLSTSISSLLRARTLTSAIAGSSSSFWGSRYSRTVQRAFRGWHKSSTAPMWTSNLRWTLALQWTPHANLSCTWLHQASSPLLDKKEAWVVHNDQQLISACK